MRSPSIPYPFPKRIVDKLIAALLLIALAPVFVVAAASAAIASGGRVLYRERRISRGRSFELLKFRTVRPDAVGESRLLERDPTNLTWAGRRILKPWYLDELPQLLNVLRGDISLVGPRPWTPEMVAEQVAKGLDYRLRVMAGLTGPAQVSKGVAGTHYTDLDLVYVKTCAMLGGWALVAYDLRILAQTIRVLARGEGLNF